MSTSVLSRPRRTGMQPATFDVDGGATTPLNPSANGKASAKPPSKTTVFDRYSHELVVPSDRAFSALLVVPLVVWWVAVLAGVWVYEGLPKGQRVYHAMIWFDKGLLRPAGPLVPFAVLMARAVVHVLQINWQLSHVVGPAAAAKRRAYGMQLGSLVLNCLTVYAAMAVARLAIYLTHFFLMSRRYLEFHLVSDHIFLAATMVICLHTEVLCLLSDIVRVERKMTDPHAKPTGLRISQVLLVALLLLALFLYCCTAADMYYTAKYFHFPLESVTTTVVVFIMFQCPMLYWIIKQRQSVHAQYTA